MSSRPAEVVDGLGCLTRIEGDLYIGFSDMEDLTGLSSLGYVGGDVRLQTNSGLTSVAGELGIIDNDALVDLAGLEGLSAVGGALLVQSNSALTDPSGLGGSPSSAGPSTSTRTSPWRTSGIP